MNCLFPGVLPLQAPRHHPRGAGHAERRLHARHRRAVPHLRRAPHLRLPLPALEAEVHEIRAVSSYTVMF